MSASRALPDGWHRIVAGMYEHPKGRVWKERRGWYARHRGSIARGPYRTMRGAMWFAETGRP